MMGVKLLLWNYRVRCAVLTLTLCRTPRRLSSLKLTVLTLRVSVRLTLWQHTLNSNFRRGVVIF